MPNPGCQELPSPAAALSVSLPGGLKLQSMPIASGVVLTDINNVQSMFAQLGPALAALKPVFTLIDTVIALKDTVTAIPGLIVGDVQTFRDALERVVNGVSSLLGMVPQVAVPILVRDAVAVLVAGLDVMDDALDQIVAMGEDVDELTALAADAPEPVKTNMLSQAECLAKQADKLLEHSVASLGPMSNLLTVMQALMDLAPGLPGLPSLGDLSGQGAEQVKEVLGTLRDALVALPL